MLVKLTPGVNFIFMLSFYSRRSRKHKKTDDLAVFFTLLDSESVKAVHRTLMKLTPGADAMKKFTPSLGIPDLGV